MMKFTFKYWCSECCQPFYSGMQLDIDDPTADVCSQCLAEMREEDDAVHDWLPEFVEVEIDSDEIKYYTEDDEEEDVNVHCPYCHEYVPNGGYCEDCLAHLVENQHEEGREGELALMFAMRGTTRDEEKVEGWQNDPYLRDMEVPF